MSNPLIKILLGIIFAIGMALLTLGVMYDRLKLDRDTLKMQVGIIINESKESERKYTERIEAYKYARDEVAKYYNEAIEAIENFKRGDNETECEAADRLLSSVKY